ncbi:MAG: hypothetical protein RLZZ380_847 [Actinomycetota bacterium]|jgi:hypothetical protein
MNKSSGCGLFSLVIVTLLAFNFLMQNPILWIVFAMAVVIIIAAVRGSQKQKQAKFVDTLEASATLLEGMGSDKEVELSVGMALNKGEKLVFVLPYVQLTEYQSTGSSYSGMNAGVSFPLFGQVRGNIGGQSGSITKNPEELMVVDQGQAVFTNQRIVFSGAKMVRDWELAKTVALEPGANGLNVKIAVSNRERTSGLQAPNIFAFGPGYPAGFVFTLNTEGESAAKKWAQGVAKQLRDTVASERAKVAPKAIEPK